MTSTHTHPQPASSSSSTPIHPAHILLARAHSPTTATSLFTTNVKQKPLLLHTTSPPSATDKRALRRHTRLRKKAYFLRKQKPPPLSAKAKRALGVHALQRDECCTYAVYEGLHRMWVGYVQEVLSLMGPSSDRKDTNVVVTANVHGSLLASADYHGAEVEVVRSGCVDRVGLKGIVVRDTKFTFVIVTVRDEVKTIPKKDTIFRFEIPLPTSTDKKTNTIDDSTNPPHSHGTKLIFELHGNQFEFRPADRANRKFKLKTTDYL